MADMRPSSLPSETPGPPTAEVLEAFAIQRHLSDINFLGADLRSALRPIAQDALFERCDFSDADMRGLNLSRSTFRDCKAQRTCFSSAALEGTRWIGGSVAFGDFTGVECIGAVFEKLDAANTRWADALMTDVRFIGCRMTGARMSGHRGLGPSFSHCNLTLASLRGMKFKGQHVESVIFNEADLAGCDFRLSALDGCSLIGASFHAADFAGADLTASDLGDLTAESARQYRGAHISMTQAVRICANLGLLVLAD